MAIIIIKKKHGEISTGEQIAKERRLDPDRDFTYIYPDSFLWQCKMMSDPVSKLSYVEAEFNTLAKEARKSRRKNKAAKLLCRLENLNRRFVNYVPECTNIYHFENWHYRNVSAKQRAYYPKYEYGYLEDERGGTLITFLQEEGINEFDFILDSHYVVVYDRDNKTWETMKKSGIIKLDEIEFEWVKP